MHVAMSMIYLGEDQVKVPLSIGQCQHPLLYENPNIRVLIARSKKSRSKKKKIWKKNIKVQCLSQKYEEETCTDNIDRDWRSDQNR